ncbi:CBM35 domain-containing protein [Streptomyces cavernae]|uniref:CBM35 domain-containing protein n=1 Tax=Streptomyces cavernae TaxID=2259034 RepID=UPI000FEBD67C|nr:CBM35 domain-containing protein [Streptomyces cavernae]
MTPGNNGASTPEDDDPFGYLYADGQANGATPPSGGGYGYPGPRSSANRVRAVGERQYTPPPSQTAQTAQYGQVPQQTQQGAYGAPSPHYAAPEATGAPVRHAPPSSGGRGRGPNTKGLLIGAIAVVAAVVIGIGVAMLGGDGEDDKSGNNAGATPSVGQSQSAQPSPTASKSAAEEGELPKADAKALKLEGGPETASDIKGAQAAGGIYVKGFNAVGAKVTWTASVEKAGKYRLYVRYGIPGVDANATLVVNGKANTQPLGMKNFINSPKGDYEKGWQSTWAPVTLNEGTNVLEISCAAGNQCDANLDQVWLQ